ncbi:MAG: hypothetical protein IID36_07925 [Planctomycetes bacterium]|nr:hypothetical protein [Planctomycetota bacterium]
MSRSPVDPTRHRGDALARPPPDGFLIDFPNGLCAKTANARPLDRRAAISTVYQIGMVAAAPGRFFGLRVGGSKPFRSAIACFLGIG